MPVIKAAAYGTYINKCIDVINEFDIVAVAVVDEAVEGWVKVKYKSYEGYVSSEYFISSGRVYS